MKNTITKPTNWKDFESLCKKLWGELWEIPYKIKKNGRIGQEEAGIDIYGIPKGERKYWGIQCMGKDDIDNAKLSESEIAQTLKSAKRFQPKLEVFIIASTFKRDASIEQYIRTKDIEHRKKRLFEILYFCWEDIVDLLKDAPVTYEWYKNGIGQKKNFDFEILFNNMQERIVLQPRFNKEIIRYHISEKSDKELAYDPAVNVEAPTDSTLSDFSYNPLFPYNSNLINKSWSSFKLVMNNCGALDLEDWSITLKFTKGVRKLDSGSPFYPNLSLSIFIEDDNKVITYHPKETICILANDTRELEVSLLPEPNITQIEMEWELIAKDYSKKGVVEIDVKPTYKEIIKTKEVIKEENLLADEIAISYHVVNRESLF